jgi:hypothetical protein
LIRRVMLMRHAMLARHAILNAAGDEEAWRVTLSVGFSP